MRTASLTGSIVLEQAAPPRRKAMPIELAPWCRSASEETREVEQNVETQQREHRPSPDYECARPAKRARDIPQAAPRDEESLVVRPFHQQDGRVLIETMRHWRRRHRGRARSGLIGERWIFADL